MGNNPNPIRNMDKRTSRRQYREVFSYSIGNYRKKIFSTDLKKKKKVENVDKIWEEGDIKVFVRKRPIFKHELENSEFDVISCVNEINQVVVHDARMHTDMKRQFINHHHFEFNEVFDENSTNRGVYLSSAANLVSIAIDGGYSTCLVYGQTGSGKTFTMTSVYEMAAVDLFEKLNSTVDRFNTTNPTLSVSFFEIAGDNCFDLLNCFTPASLLTGSDGSVYPYPLVEPKVSSPMELIAVIQHGIGVRTTAATGVHDASSRSHAMLRIYIQRNDKGENIEGTLNLVDLAGSEHRIDSMYHSKERRKECGNINASLMALKDCIRARAEGKNLSHQYRRSKLTMALKSSFTMPQSRTIVIATVSPASKDTEHSLNTLRHACIMQGDAPTENKDGEVETRFVTGGKIIKEEIGAVNVTEIARANLAAKKQGIEPKGLKTSNGNHAGNTKRSQNASGDKAVSTVGEIIYKDIDHFEKEPEKEITEKERRRARRAAEKRSIAKMDPMYRDILYKARSCVGKNSHQMARLRRGSLPEVDTVEEEEYHIVDPNRSDGCDEDEEVRSELQNHFEEIYDEEFDHYASKNNSPVKKDDKGEDEDESIEDTQAVIQDHSNESHVSKRKLSPESPSHVVKDHPSKGKADGRGQRNDIEPIEVYNALRNPYLMHGVKISDAVIEQQFEAIMRLLGWPAAEISENYQQIQKRTDSAIGMESVRSASSKEAKKEEFQYKRMDDVLNNFKGNPMQYETDHPVVVDKKLKEKKVVQAPMMTVEEKVVSNVDSQLLSKAKKKAEDLARAALQLEQEAALRKKRQDAAKAVKDKINQAGKKLIEEHSHQPDSVSISSDPIAYLEKEIVRLVKELQSNNELTAASVHGLKMNIAKHKAALMKARRVQEENMKNATPWDEAAPPNDQNGEMSSYEGNGSDSRNGGSQQTNRSTSRNRYAPITSRDDSLQTMNPMITERYTKPLSSDGSLQQNNYRDEQSFARHLPEMMKDYQYYVPDDSESMDRQLVRARSGSIRSKLQPRDKNIGGSDPRLRSELSSRGYAESESEKYSTNKSHRNATMEEQMVLDSYLQPVQSSYGIKKPIQNISENDYYDNASGGRYSRGRAVGAAAAPFANDYT